MNLKVGSVYELRTNRGLVYVQGTNLCENGGVMVMRLIAGMHDRRPESFDGATRFFFLLSVNASAHAKKLTKVGDFDIPEDSRAFPVFRNGTRVPGGKVVDWWLWDGTNEVRVGQIGDDQRKFPFREYPSYPVLIERIESGWTPETDQR